MCLPNFLYVFVHFLCISCLVMISQCSPCDTHSPRSVHSTLSQENVQWTSSSVLPVVSVSTSVQSVIVVVTVLMAAMNKTVPVSTPYPTSPPSIQSVLIMILTMIAIIIVECTEEELRCSDDTCVNMNVVCDGNFNCDDGLDEQNCPSESL